PVLDDTGRLVGVVTRRDLDAGGEGTVGERVRRSAVVAFEDESLRQAADRMVLARVGRLPVVSRAAPTQVIGIVTRSDLLAAHAQRLEEATVTEQAFELKNLWAD